MKTKFSLKDFLLKKAMAHPGQFGDSQIDLWHEEACGIRMLTEGKRYKRENTGRRLREWAELYKKAKDDAQRERMVRNYGGLLANISQNPLRYEFRRISFAPSPPLPAKPLFPGSAYERAAQISAQREYERSGGQYSLTLWP